MDLQKKSKSKNKKQFLEIFGQDKKLEHGKEVSDVIAKLEEKWKMKKSKIELYFCKNPADILEQDSRTFV